MTDTEKHSVRSMNPDKGYKATDLLKDEQGTEATVGSINFWFFLQINFISNDSVSPTTMPSKSLFFTVHLSCCILRSLPELSNIHMNIQ